MTPPSPPPNEGRPLQAAADTIAEIEMASVFGLLTLCDNCDTDCRNLYGEKGVRIDAPAMSRQIAPQKVGIATKLRQFTGEKVRIMRQSPCALEFVDVYAFVMRSAPPR